jgi:hypothetical protein
MCEKFSNAATIVKPPDTFSMTAQLKLGACPDFFRQDAKQRLPWKRLRISNPGSSIEIGKAGGVAANNSIQIKHHCAVRGAMLA